MFEGSLRTLNWITAIEQIGFAGWSIWKGRGRSGMRGGMMTAWEKEVRAPVLRRYWTLTTAWSYEGFIWSWT